AAGAWLAWMGGMQAAERTWPRPPLGHGRAAARRHPVPRASEPVPSWSMAYRIPFGPAEASPRPLRLKQGKVPKMRNLCPIGRIKAQPASHANRFCNRAVVTAKDVKIELLSSG